MLQAAQPDPGAQLLGRLRSGDEQAFMVLVEMRADFITLYRSWQNELRYGR